MSEIMAFTMKSLESPSYDIQLHAQFLSAGGYRPVWMTHGERMEQNGA